LCNGGVPLCDVGVRCSHVGHGIVAISHMQQWLSLVSNSSVEVMRCTVQVLQC